MTKAADVIQVGGASVSHPLDCNVYLVDSGGGLAMVDAGGGRARDVILDNVERSGRDPRAITHLFLTHGHGDHAAGAAGIAEAVPGLRLHASPHVRDLLARGDDAALSVEAGRDAGLYPPDFTIRPVAASGDLTGGARFDVGGVTVEVLETPGHCAGHVSLLLQREQGGPCLFAGDAVFPGGLIALQPLHDCSLADQVATLRSLRTLDIEGLFAGHLDPVPSGGHADVEAANAALDRLLLPPPLNPPPATSPHPRRVP